MGRRRAAVWVVSLTGGVVAALAGLAVNAATGDARWPGILDVIRRNAWTFCGLLIVTGLFLSAVLRKLEGDPAPVASDPPPPPPPPLDDWLVTREQTAELVATLCRPRRRQGTVALTTALKGAGGFGKTQLACTACADPRVRRYYRNRVYPVTVGRDVRTRAQIAAAVTQATLLITGDTTVFTNPAAAGDHLGRLLSVRPPTLLVLDDVWTREQLDPFRRAAAHCTLLVTTRIPSLLPTNARQIHVDQLTRAQARQVLTADLPALPEPTVHALLNVTGCWPLLLRLTNRLIAAEIATGLSPVQAGDSVLVRLRQRGPVVVDASNLVLDVNVPSERAKAVRATVEAATGLLPGSGAARYSELGIFAEDEAIPVPLITQLWQQTGALSPEEARSLCRQLADLSLLTLSSQAGGQVTLHDVYRDYLRAELGHSGQATANQALITAVAAALPAATPLTLTRPVASTAWWTTTDGYLLDHAIDHLLAAGHTAEAEATATDVRWIETRLQHRGPNAPWSDLTQIPTPTAEAAARDLARAAHLLQPTDPPHLVLPTLYSRLQPLPQWHDQVEARQQQPGPPVLLNQHTPPDLPDPALMRILTGHTDWVKGVAISPDGTWLATGSRDGTVRIWDRVTGTGTATLTGHTLEVNAVAISPDGTWLATGSDDRAVRIWDRVTGTATATLTGRTGRVKGVAISPDGTWLATASNDGTIRIWQPSSPEPVSVMRTDSSSLHGCAWAPDGRTLAVVGDRGLYLYTFRP